MQRLVFSILLAACGDDAAATDAGSSGTDSSVRRDSGGGRTDAGGGDDAGGLVDAGGMESIAAALEDARLELPCENPDPMAYASDGATCNWDPDLLAMSSTVPEFALAIEREVTIGGDPGTIYAITMRFRGVSEPKNYEGGTLVGDHFYIGGTEIRNDYNIYSIEVADPAETYYLTRTETPTGHYTIAFDYEGTIRARGGTTLTLGIYDHNTVAIANWELRVVDGIPPAPAPYSGHFVHMNVVSVVAE